MLIDQIRHITEELGMESPIDSALLKLVQEGYLIYDREGTLLNEGILKKALGVGALAAGMAFGNTRAPPRNQTNRPPRDRAPPAARLYSRLRARS